jgi:DNA-binding IclR family transcriptional regulator
LGFTEPQARSLPHLKIYRQISRSEFCELTGVQKSAAHRELSSLAEKGLVARQGRG